MVRRHFDTAGRYASFCFFVLLAVGGTLAHIHFPWAGLMASLLLVVIALTACSFFFLPDTFLRLFGLITLHLGYRMKVEGVSKIPRTGGVLLICNHVSFLDWLIIVAASPRPPRFVIDHAFYIGGPIASAMSLVRVIPIATPREDRGRLASAYDRIAEELARGEVVCIFPEGQITYDGFLAPFKPGVLRILRKNPVPVVPIALSGLWGSVFSRRGGPALRKLPRRFRARVTVKVGEIIPAEEATIARLTAEVAALRGPGEPVRPLNGEGAGPIAKSKTGTEAKA